MYSGENKDKVSRLLKSFYLNINFHSDRSSQQVFLGNLLKLHDSSTINCKGYCEVALI